MVLLNFDSMPKFFVSFGVTLLFLAMVGMLGYLWVVDQQSDKFIDAGFKVMEFGNDTNFKIAEEIFEVQYSKVKFLENMQKPWTIALSFFVVIGAVFIITGLLQWHNQENKK